MTEREEGIKITPEIIEAAKQANSADDIIELAQEHGIELTAEEAQAEFARVRATDAGEIADEELDNVTGGCGRPERPCPHCGSEDHTFRYTIENFSCNDHVYWCNSCNNYFTVTEFDGGVSVY